MALDIEVLDPFLATRARKPGQLVDTIVLHATAGKNYTGARDTLRKKGFSYHYIVEKNGKIHKTAPISKTAFHAGVSVGPHGANVNNYSIGISMVNLNDGKDPYPDTQYEAVKNLILEIIKFHPEVKILTTHAIISPGRKTDPLKFKSEQMAEDTGLDFWKP